VNLADVPRFKEFTAGIAERWDEQPVPMTATVVGSHRCSVERVANPASRGELTIPRFDGHLH